MRGSLIPVLLVGALALTGCAAADPEPTDAPRPPSMDGEWSVERIVTESYDEVTSPVGSEAALAVLFTEEDCTATECTGTVTSGLTIEDREVASATGTYVNTAETITYEFEEIFAACIADGGGTVIAENAYANQVSYTGTITEADADRVTGYTATGVRVSRTTEIGLALEMCRPDDGEVLYDLTATRAG